MTLKKYKYILFSPYFGKLPVNFDLWLHSCSYNKDFKFIVFTDDKTKYNIPENVEMIYSSFNEFKENIQKKFSFKISLNNPYKLCDFRPAYGYIFSDYIENCDYWGHCDLDLIFGNISKYLPKDEYDKISYLGHLCMYKNNDKINKIFMNESPGIINYKEIFSDDQHFACDEIGNYGINSILKRNNCKIYNLSINVADVNSRKERMYVVKFKDGKFFENKDEKIFIFDHGKVYSFDLKTRQIDEEFAYVHFQKRKMINNVKNVDKFIIKYDGFIDYTPIDDNYSGLSPSKKVDLKWLKFKYNGVKRRIKRQIKIKEILKKRGNK